MAIKLILVNVLLFVAVVSAGVGTTAVAKVKTTTSSECSSGRLDAACDALCWIVIPYRFDTFFYTGCLDSHGRCWCCTPRLSTSHSYGASSYGGYGGGGYGGVQYSYACPDDPSCVNDCYLTSIFGICVN